MGSRTLHYTAFLHHTMVAPLPTSTSYSEVTEFKLSMNHWGQLTLVPSEFCWFPSRGHGWDQVLCWESTTIHIPTSFTLDFWAPFPEFPMLLKLLTPPSPGLELRQNSWFWQLGLRRFIPPWCHLLSCQACRAVGSTTHIMRAKPEAAVLRASFIYYTPFPSSLAQPFTLLSSL